MMRRMIQAACLIAVVSSAHASILVGEGVDFSARSGLYTYRYALDNRAGTKIITDFGILIIPGVALDRLPPLPHTSPPGWNMVTSVGGGSVGGGGTFQEWYTTGALLPGQYLSGFSFTTSQPPRSSTTTNYYVHSPQSGVGSGPLELGSIEAPELISLVPALGTFAKVMLMFAVAAIGSLVLLRRI